MINNPKDNYYVWKIEDFVFNEHIFKALKKYQEAGYLLIIISNQSGVAKGFYTKEDVGKLHNYMNQRFKEFDIFISEIYYCPHHPDYTKCLCRKPDSLMLEKALARFNINPKQSFFIGDSQTDIQAAEKAGIKGILIKKNGELPVNLASV